MDAPGTPAWVEPALRARESALAAISADADSVVRACRDMAERFQRGGKLVVFGAGALAADAAHIAVEFVHPVLVGKPALPAVSLTTDVASITDVAIHIGFDAAFASQVCLMANPADITLGLSTGLDGDAVARGLLAGRDLGTLTVLISGALPEVARQPIATHELLIPSSDPRLVKEALVTSYHLLWELVHVYFEQAGRFTPGRA